MERIREIAKPGIYKDGVVITEKMLKEIYDNFQTVNSAPVTLTHNIQADTPRLGSVTKLYLKGGSLYARVNEKPALSKAVDEGYFPECSIGAKQNYQGKWYLHHLAYPGEEPPAIKDLKNNIKEALLATDKNDNGNILILPSVKILTERKINLSDEGEYMDELEKAKQRIAELEAELAEAKKAGGSTPDDNALKQENETLKKQLADLQVRFDKAKSEHPEIELSDANATTRMLYAELQASQKTALRKAAEGKIPKHALDRLVALSDSLSVSKSITLSDSKEKASAIDVLTGIFEALPDNKFLQNELTLSDAQSSDKEKPVDYAALLASM